MQQTILAQYQALKNKYDAQYVKARKKHNALSIIRLAVFFVLIFTLYNYFQNLDNKNYLYLAVFMLFVFILSIRSHSKLKRNMRIRKMQKAVNQNEINYIKGESLPFKDGAVYADLNHLYSFDLDLFGPNSLFQHLNRTATHMGSKKLADWLSKPLKSKEIKQNQAAVKELSEKLAWRQQIQALGLITNDKKSYYEKIIAWTKQEQKGLSRLVSFLSYVLPLVLFALILSRYFIDIELLTNIIGLVFLLNLAVTLSQLGKIKNETMDSDVITSIFQNYSSIIESIEKQYFKSEKLCNLKSVLNNESEKVSSRLKTLSRRFSSVQNIQNVMGFVLLNGLFLYHLHAFRALLQWKQKNTAYIKDWLTVIGEIEALSSMANFYFNNPDFVFPQLNKNVEIKFQDMGHPLIFKQKRICNDVYFKEGDFMVLSGSNMSGKSTFLRALGANMVLCAMGSAVCATQADVHTMQTLVSMRQTDSLSQGDSYFFAEIKRLKQLINELDAQLCFVLLDEILKGTNAVDKETGTIAIIEKIMGKKAIGVIATHDLAVCKMAQSHPDRLYNKCFEANIMNNELVFDYKLRDGISKNKSATFLMKKMQII